jgi:hypothetical protein
MNFSPSTLAKTCLALVQMLINVISIKDQEHAKDQMRTCKEE